MSDKAKKRLSARPKVVSVVCVTHELQAVRCLAKSLSSCGIKPESLILADGLCLGITLNTKTLPKLLPRICEHSDTVCIGRFYPELFSEHGKPIAVSDAMKLLSSE